MAHTSLPAVSTDARRKRVLIVHYFFPPLGGAGVPRILKFVKYLPELGWDVAVVTSSADVRWYAPRDERSLSEVPPTVRVIRVGEIPITPARRRVENVLRRLRLEKVGAYAAWPDETIGWLPFAAAAAHRAARRWRPDVIMSSSYPYTAHAVALVASRLNGVPWVADFRDPWSRNAQPVSQPAPLPRLNVRAERALVRRAGRLVLADEHWDLVGLEDDDPRRVVIENGVDEADFPLTHDVMRAVPTDCFRLAYVGSLYGTRDAAPVFQSIARLASNGVIDPERFEVAIVGNVWLGSKKIDAGSIRVEHIGYVDHSRAVREMCSATALLFYAPPTTWAPSGKIFEYLLSGRPILAVARADNLAYELVDELRAGRTAEPGDPAGIDRAIEELYRLWSTGSLTVGPEVRERTLARFSRRHLTAKLAHVLDQVSSGVTTSVGSTRSDSVRAPADRRSWNND
jgi:glycosyltransferase involved in cell wall biosynthesis